MTVRAHSSPDTSEASDTSGAVLTVRQMAADLQVSEPIVRRLCADGTIPGYRVGKQWRCNVDDFETWKRERARRRARLLRTL